MYRRFVVPSLLLPLLLGCGAEPPSGKGGAAPAAGAGRIPVLVVSTRGCVNTPPTIRLLEETARELGASIDLRTALVSTAEEARERRFHGSPTVQVDGLDLDPAMRGSAAYGFT